jgi:hypothetical protein
MVRRALPVVLALAATLVVALAFQDEGSAQSRGGPGQRVEVVNFPEVQKVEVRGAPRQAMLAAFENQIVSAHGGSRDPGSWRHAGVLRTDGFGWVVLSLGGELQGVLTEPGAAVAVLVPDAGPVLRALKEDGVLLFPLQATATLVPGREYFTSQPERLAIGFPRYQVYLYNTSARTIEAHLYAYLGN